MFGSVPSSRRLDRDHMGSLPNISSHLSTYHLVDSHSFDLDVSVVGPGYASDWN